MTLFYILLGLAALCFGVSCWNGTARKKYLWFYFGIVLLSEISYLLEWINYTIYINFITLITLYFIFYYSLDSKNKKLFGLLAVLPILISILFWGYNEHQIVISVVMSFVYILLSLRWFVLQLKKVDEHPIFKKQSFWISTALLLIGIISIFRMVPMYFFNVADKDFLLLVNTSYLYLVITSYLLFLKACFCKI